MIAAGLMALAAAAAMQAQPAPGRMRSASMGVGATVVRPEPQPRLAIRGAAVIVSNAGRFSVSAQGGATRRLDGGTILVTPGAAGRMTITLTY